MGGTLRSHGPFNTNKTPLALGLVLQGMRREHGDAVNRKLPITPALLRSILSHLYISVSVDIVVWAACLPVPFHEI